MRRIVVYFCLGEYRVGPSRRGRCLVEGFHYADIARYRSERSKKGFIALDVVRDLMHKEIAQQLRVY